MADVPLPRVGPSAPTARSLWAPVVAYMAVLFGLSSLSTIPSPPADFSFYDVHVGAYAVLGVLAARAFGAGMRTISVRAVVAAALLSSAYGVTDEYHQKFVPGRSFDVYDMAADAVGSVIGASAAGAWSIIARRFDALRQPANPA